ncbi:MAG TPA: response regulator transcription factor [Actinomycetota bacterium]|nr:response regulator transcription factor [Actinomycetota bacterium]
MSIAQQGSSPVRLLLVEDHEIVLQGLQRLLSDTDSVEVVASARALSEAWLALQRCEVDVALVDIGLPDGSGLDLCRHIAEAHPAVRTIVLSAHADSHTICSAIEAGASGFLSKGGGLDGLLAALQTPPDGGFTLEPDLQGGLMEVVWMRSLRLPDLTRPEEDVFFSLADGLSDREIAGRLHLSAGTVRNLVSSMLRKLELQSRTQAALLAARLQRPARLDARRGATPQSPVTDVTSISVSPASTAGRTFRTP